MLEQLQEIRQSYQVLGAEIGAPFSEVKKNYMALIKQWHPDISAVETQRAEEEAKKINEALHRIKSLSGREIAAAQRYFGMLGGLENPSPGSSARRTRRPRATGRNRPPAPSGGWTRAPGWRSEQSPVVGPHRQGRDLLGQILVTPEQARRGSQWRFQIATCWHCGGWGAAPELEFQICSTCAGLGLARGSDGAYDLEALCPRCAGQGCISRRPCGSCGGTGEKDHFTVRCSVAPMDGRTFTGVLPGQGHRGLAGGKNGDLYLRVSIRK